MGAHLIDGEFQSDKYPTCPRGKVPLSCKDPTAQDLLWEYAQRRHSVDAEFSTDLEAALIAAGYDPKPAVSHELRIRKIDGGTWRIIGCSCGVSCDTEDEYAIHFAMPAGSFVTPLIGVMRR